MSYCSYLIVCRIGRMLLMDYEGYIRRLPSLEDPQQPLINVVDGQLM